MRFVLNQFIAVQVSLYMPKLWIVIYQMDWLLTKRQRFFSLFSHFIMPFLYNSEIYVNHNKYLIQLQVVDEKCPVPVWLIT